MKSVRMHSRAGPEALVYDDAPLPQIRPGDALVRVKAAGITPYEFTWSSTFTTAEGKYRFPIIPSFEVSGVVERTGPDVSEVSEGDEVYGLLNFWRNGAAAEYVAAKASDLAPKPKSIDHVHSSALPLSGLTAWQALFDHMGLSNGQRLLIHAGAGGVGTYAVQLAHWRGVNVISTASRGNASFLRALGADQVLDYTTVRFEDEIESVDAVLDTVGGETLERSWGIIRRGGTLVTIVGDTPEEKTSKYGVHGASILVQPNRSELVQLSQLVDSGVIRPVVEAVYALPQAREAYERGLLGHNRGKLVLKVED